MVTPSSNEAQMRLGTSLSSRAATWNGKAGEGEEDTEELGLGDVEGE